MSPDSECLLIDGCALTISRARDADESQYFLLCTPPGDSADPAVQANAIYTALSAYLATAGVPTDAILRETLFLADATNDLDAIRNARDAVLTDPGCRPAMLAIQQPPLDAAHRLEVALQISHLPPGRAQPLHVELTNESGLVRGSGLVVNGEKRLHAAAIVGTGATAVEQTRTMFEAAEALLQEADMSFADVVRTWIHFSEMDRDYAQFNEARRAFFDTRGIQPAPASTGIGGGVAEPGRSLCLGFYAVSGEQVVAPQVMTTPTLNEAPQYGADFSRGMRVAQGGGAMLFVSGTASLDETGATVHQGDTGAQIERMLLNLRMLLQEQGADFGNVVSAITYLNDAADTQLLRDRLTQAGFDGFPNALVNARICRPDLLCEIELLARI